MKVKYDFKKLYKICQRNFTLKTVIDTDVIVLGGGVVGLSVVNSFIKAGITDKILLVDPSQRQLPQNFIYKKNRIPDIRCISLTPASMNFFESIDVGKNFNQTLLTYVEEMQIYEKEGSNFINFNSTQLKSIKNFIPIGGKNETNKYISVLTELSHIVYALEKNIEHVESLQIKIENDDINIEPSSEEYTIIRIKDNYYRTKLLIVSDGQKSIVRNKLNPSMKKFEYNETALVATLIGNKNTKTSYQRFVHNGIFALLPMYDNIYSIVCSMPTNFNEKLKSLSNNEFINFVNNILHSKSEKESFSIFTSDNFQGPPIMTECISKLITFPLILQYVEDLVHHGNIIFIGDTAHSVHPMAGQGLNLGIADAAILANCLSKGKKLGKRINDKLTLNEFNTKSKLNTKCMIATMEIIKSVYGTENSIITGLRNFGMNLINSSEHIKGLLTDSGSGKLFLPSKYDWEI